MTMCDSSAFKEEARCDPWISWIWRDIGYLESEALTAYRAQLSAEYAEAIDMISAGCVMVSISNRLRRSLAHVADEVQGAINDGAILTADDLAMLYVAETKKIEDEFEVETDEIQNNYARPFLPLRDN